jgi:hypothetical protein
MRRPKRVGARAGELSGIWVKKVKMAKVARSMSLLRKKGHTYLQLEPGLLCWCDAFAATLGAPVVAVAETVVAVSGSISAAAAAAAAVAAVVVVVAGAVVAVVDVLFVACCLLRVV